MSRRMTVSDAEDARCAMIQIAAEALAELRGDIDDGNFIAAEAVEKISALSVWNYDDDGQFYDWGLKATDEERVAEALRRALNGGVRR